jgi:hypothetical protein|tara:strand:+ start:983 stop:1222 length:240 start_codon:yes stop_codon:yes gene_type:complete
MKKYVIITSSDVSSVDFSKVQETSADTLRYNMDGTKTFVKYTGSKPSFLDGKTEYTNEEILAILNDVDGEWFIEDTSLA